MSEYQHYSFFFFFQFREHNTFVEQKEKNQFFLYLISVLTSLYFINTVSQRIKWLNVISFSSIFKI